MWFVIYINCNATITPTTLQTQLRSANLCPPMTLSGRDSMQRPRSARVSLETLPCEAVYRALCSAKSMPERTESSCAAEPSLLSSRVNKEAWAFCLF